MFFSECSWPMYVNSLFPNVQQETKRALSLISCRRTRHSHFNLPGCRIASALATLVLRCTYVLSIVFLRSVQLAGVRRSGSFRCFGLAWMRQAASGRFVNSFSPKRAVGRCMRIHQLSMCVNSFSPNVVGRCTSIVFLRMQLADVRQ